MSNIISELDRLIATCWNNILADVDGTVVYIDHSATECLHWYTAGKGYLALKDAGAIAVQELDMYHFPYVEVRGTKKAVVVSTSSEPAFYQRTIKTIIGKNVFESCRIYCAAPCDTTNYFKTGSTDERLNYVQLKRDVKAWMSLENLSQEPSVDIIHVPLFIALLNRHLFVTPPFGDLMPSLDTAVPKGTLSELYLLASSFYELLDKLNVRMDIYSVGILSDCLAENLEECAGSTDRRNHTAASGVPENGVSLVFIDRTLDLCTPTSSNTESFLSKILRTFRHLPHHNNDIAIGMSPMLGTVEGVLQGCQVPGCLADIEKSQMDLVISKKEKQSVLLALSNDQVLPKDPLSKEEVAMFRREELRSIVATVEAPRSPKTGQLELLTSLEKLALQNLSVSREFSSILVQLSNVIRTRKHRGLDTENLLALLIHVYALAGTQVRFSMEHERQLEQSIADAIFEDFQISRENPSAGRTTTSQRTLLPLGTNDDVVLARETSYKIAARIVNTLRSVAEQRATLKDYRFFMIKPDPEDTIRRVGVLEQVARDIVCTGIAREFRDLRQISSSSFISAGFNLLLRGKTKRHPCDNPLILIYIVGGITAEEGKIIQQLASTTNDKSAAPYIILGGSRLLNPLDIVDNIFFC